MEYVQAVKTHNKDGALYAGNMVVFKNPRHFIKINALALRNDT